MDAEESRRTVAEDDAMDTSASVAGKRCRTTEDAAEFLGGLPENPEK